MHKDRINNIVLLYFVYRISYIVYYILYILLLTYMICHCKIIIKTKSTCFFFFYHLCDSMPIYIRYNHVCKYGKTSITKHLYMKSINYVYSNIYF